MEGTYIFQNIYNKLRYANIYQLNKEYMQSAKGSQHLKYEHYEISITAFSEKKLQITVVDTIERMQFHEKLLTLNNIGTTTLLKALSKKAIQIKIGLKVNKTAQNAILQIDVLVASQFLRPVQQTIYLKKSRDISESQILKSAVNSLSSKVKLLKDDDKNKSNIVRVGTIQPDEKSYNTGAVYDPIAAIKLPKVKATATWMYIYFQQGQQCIQNCGFYVPSGTQFLPMTIRKSYTVVNNEQNVQFTTYYGQSYPATLKDVILTAQSIE